MHSQAQKSPFSRETQEISAVSRRLQDNPEELEKLICNHMSPGADG